MMIPERELHLAKEAVKKGSANEVILLRFHSHHKEELIKGIWVFDRGFDDEKLFTFLVSLHLKYVIRIKENRHLIPLHKPHLKRMSVCRISLLLDRNKEHLSFVPVQLPQSGLQGTLVINYEGKEPCYFFTVLPVHNDADARALIHYYTKRWAVEDSDRAFKNIFDIENIRSRTFLALQRLIHIAIWAFAVLFRIALLPKKIVSCLLDSVKAFDTSAKIIYYRLAKAITLIFSSQTDQFVFR